MVGMGISSELVLGHDHLRPDAADHLDQAADRFLLARLPEGLRLAVAREPGHAGILVSKKHDLVDPEDLHRLAQLRLTNRRQPGRCLLGIEFLVEDFTHLATRRGHQGGSHPFRAVARQRPTHADGLIVGMGLDCQQAQLAGAHLPLRARTSWINCGTILCTSPMTPRSASLKIGASGSLLMAMIVFAPFIPTVCCIAPEIPTAM